MERSQPEILKIGEDYLDVNFQARSIRKNHEELHLTPTEYNIFELLVKSPGRAFTREQIIEFALKDEYDGYDRNVDTYIKYLRQKIEQIQDHHDILLRYMVLDINLYHKEQR